MGHPPGWIKYERWEKCKPAGTPGKLCKRHPVHKKILGVWYGVFESWRPPPRKRGKKNG